MIFAEKQKKEIATIKERTVKLNLSDADCDRLSQQAAKVGLTVSELLENFIGDLVNGTYSNGSDERMYANEWFERCGFSMLAEEENTLFRHLIEWGECDEYFELMDNIETAEAEKKYLKEHPEEADEEAQYLDDYIADWQEALREMREEWNSTTEPDIEKEHEIIRKWAKERDDLLNKGE